MLLGVWGMLTVAQAEPMPTAAPAVSTAVAAAETPFIATASRKLRLFEKRDEKSRVLRRFEVGETLSVVAYDRQWVTVRAEGVTGYVRAPYIERLQRRDPFAEPLPGATAQLGLATLTGDITFLPDSYENPITLLAGTRLTVQSLTDENALIPFMRVPEAQALPLAQLKLGEQVVPWQEAQPGDLISAYTTYYSTSLSRHLNAGRMANLALSCQRLTGVVIPAGQQFSYNAICAPYTQANGYQRAPIISSEDGAAGFGGGTCQVSSTLYNAVIRVPSTIDDHHLHSFNGVKYLPASFDATVGDRWDFVFTNVLDYDLRLAAWAGDGAITVCLYRN